MANFTATIETDIFTYEVKTNIDETGVNIIDIYFGEDPLTFCQLIHFITVYGEAYLDDEIMAQYDAWVKDQAEDKLIENFETNQGEI